MWSHYPAIPVGGGAVDTNDWCIKDHCFHMQNSKDPYQTWRMPGWTEPAGPTYHGCEKALQASDASKSLKLFMYH